MDDLLIRVLTRLLRVHDELGNQAFEAAAHGALVSIARSVHSSIDAPKIAVDENGVVVPFPQTATIERDPPA